MATIYMATLGKQGLQRVGELSAAKAHYAAEQLTKVPGVSLRFSAPFFKEFTLRLPKSPSSIVARLAKKRILPGTPLKTYDRTLADCLLVAVTEQRTREGIDAYAAALAEVLRWAATTSWSSSSRRPDGSASRCRRVTCRRRRWPSCCRRSTYGARPQGCPRSRSSTSCAITRGSRG